MYAGKVVEDAPTSVLLSEPMHPYTMGLKNAFPDIKGAEAGTLVPIAGRAARPRRSAARAAASPPRCPFALERCRAEEPPLREMAPDGHRVACHRAERGGGAARRGRPPRDLGRGANDRRPADRDRGRAAALHASAPPISAAMGRPSTVKAVDGVSFTLTPRRKRGPSGRKRLRQDVDGPPAGASWKTATGGSVRFDGDEIAGSEGRGAAALSRARADDLPEPVRRGESALHHRPLDGRAAGQCRHAPHANGASGPSPR